MEYSRRRAIRALSGLGLAMAGGVPLAAFGQHQHGHAAGGRAGGRDLGTGAAFDREGRLWTVTKDTDGQNQYVVLRHTADLGKTWSAPVRVLPAPEPVAASGEARPHIAFGTRGEIYVSFTSTTARPHIGDIRFVRSLDGGKTFSAPLTVQADRSRVTHSFESMVVDPQGRIFVAWVDGRDAERAKQRKEKYAGSAIYCAVSTDSGASFGTEYKVADHSCECCRIGLALNDAGRPVAAWRHVFSPNIRDHALAELGPDGRLSDVSRVTFDNWRVDACPHHGPSVAYTADGTRHLVWFNGKEGPDAGAWYSASAAGGKPGAPVKLGSAMTSHPDLIVQGKQLAVVWKEFDGKTSAVMARTSSDGGKRWQPLELARTAGASDSPYLVSGPSGAVLVWRTQDEGTRAVPLA